jgi:hypothetical protein
MGLCISRQGWSTASQKSSLYYAAFHITTAQKEGFPIGGSDVGSQPWVSNMHILRRQGTLFEKKQLHTKEGYERIRHYVRRYTSKSCWNEKESCFIEDRAIGVGHKISVRAVVVSEQGADGDSWNVIKLHILSQKLI